MKETRLLAPFLILAIHCSASAQASPQGASGCNDTVRSLSTSGGTTQTDTDCSDVSITISIAGQAFEWSSPDTCPNGFRVQDSDCFTCESPAAGSNCLDDQFRVLVKVYSSGENNPCPSFPESLPETLADAYRSTQCTPPPLLNEENVKCSASAPCADEEPVPDTYFHGNVREDPTNPAGIRREWLGDLAGSMPGPVENPAATFIDALPRISVEDLPGPVAAMKTRCPGFAGMDGVSARVVLEYPYGDVGDPILNTYDVFGTILADGRFALMMPRWVETENGGHERVLEDLAYDGATLAYGQVGAETYQAYASTCSVTGSVLLAQTGFLRSLMTWCGDPFECMALAGTEFEVEVQPTGATTVTESYPEPDFPSWSGMQVYTLGGSQVGGLPTRIDTLSQAGTLVRRREFSKYRQLKDGTWRPFHIVDSRYSGGSETPRFVMRTTIQSLSKTYESVELAEPVFHMPKPASGWWVVHE